MTAVPRPKRHHRSRRSRWTIIAMSALTGFGVVAGLSSVQPSLSLVAPPSTNRSTTTSPTTPSTSHPTTTTPITSPPTVRSATGTLEQYGYGQLAVRVTVRGSTVTGLSVSTLQTAESFSQQLAQQAIPVLQNEVLTAQSTAVTAVSGATYTSEAYLSSIQSALDSLGV